MKAEEQLDAINRILALAQASEFYRGRIPPAIPNLEEMKNIPFTSKEDLRQHSPFGLLCVDRIELYQYHESFGTTGTPISTWFTRDDMEQIARILSCWGVNLNENDRVLIRFPYAISSPAHQLHAAAHLCNACVIPVSSRNLISPFPRVLEIMKKLEVTVLAGLPLQAVLLAETAEILGMHPSADFPHLRAICTAGEPLPDARRRLIEEIWGVPVYDHYGMTELGPTVLECTYKNPHLAEDSFYLELLDEELREEVPEGEVGQIVITSLKRRANPLIRYITGDRGMWIKKACPCGQERILRIRGRKEDVLRIGDKVFDRWTLEEMISQLPCRRFWAAAPYGQALHLLLEKEHDEDLIASDLIARLEENYGVKLHVELLPKGALYDRRELLAIGIVGKPRYIYSQEEIEQNAHLHGARI